MKIIMDYEFNDLLMNCWCGATDTLHVILKNNKGDELMEHLEGIFSEHTPTDTEVNDYLWFESDYIYECLGIDIEG